MMGISAWQLMIVLLILIILFGGKRIRSLGGDLGASIRDFRKSARHDRLEEK
ncbi:twin-arginine translocase TatA/TatE family subunit [Bacterioplanoides pacificum]|uniref:Sec-independent protein translocase protein TatA n=1 Tax=Bacterioplanoides pacificum TaxID=1171596 RepID=A0ABV7VUY6_9GAMM